MGMKALLLAAALAWPVAGAAAPLPPGTPAPDFELPVLGGGRLSLVEMRAGDRPVVLSFFATWCESCLKEIKYLRGVAARHGATVYLVGIDPGREKLERFVGKEGIEFPVLHDPGGQTTGKKYDLFRGAFAVVPKAYVISPTGTVEHVSESYDGAIAAMLDRKVAEVKAKKWEKGREVTLFFTGSGNGRLTGSAGGLARLVSYIKAKRERNPGCLLVDTGDFLPPSVSTAAAGRIFGALALAGYDVLGVGDQEAAYGGLAAAAARLPLLASSPGCRAGRCALAGVSEKVVERAGVKIRFLSFAPPEAFALYPEEFTSGLEFRKPEDLLKDGEKADFLVLLLHAGAGYGRKIAGEAGGVDLIVGGHTQTAEAAFREGKTLVAQAGAEFRSVGRLTLKFDAGKKLSGYDYELAPLAADIPEDPGITALAGGVDRIAFERTPVKQ